MNKKTHEITQEIKDNILRLMELGEIEELYGCSRFILETLFTGQDEDDDSHGSFWERSSRWSQ